MDEKIREALAIHFRQLPDSPKRKLERWNTTPEAWAWGIPDCRMTRYNVGWRFSQITAGAASRCTSAVRKN
jgi:hypothetical protein